MNTPIFDLLCLEYPELAWSQDATTIRSFQNQVLREAYGRLVTL